MIRNSVLVLTALLSASGVAGANVTGGFLGQSFAHRDVGWMARDANPKHAWLYTASGQNDDTVRIYDLEGVFGPHEIGEITDGLHAPNGMAVDSAGTLYVANWNSNNPGGGVTIYPAGSVSPSLTLTQGLSVPLDAAADSEGNVYVANRGASPAIVVYAKGQTAPSKTIASSLITSPAQVQVDPSNNVYFADSNTGVSEIPYGSEQPISLGFQGLSVWSGLTLDPRNGWFYAADSQRVLAFQYGSPHPVRTLHPVFCAFFLASGTVKGAEWIFAPQCQSDEVWVFRSGARKALAPLDLPGAGTVNSVAFKPAGVP